MRQLSALVLAGLLASCVSAPSRGPVRPASSVKRPPPMRPAVPPPAKQGFIAPTVMHRAGLEEVIGRDSSALQRVFGKPRLDVREGDAMKLQFAGPQCVLDIYLYPLRPGATPTATDVEARRASDGLDVDRAACVAALKR